MVLPSALLEYVFSLCTLKQIEASLSAIRERLTSTSATAAVSSCSPTLKERTEQRGNRNVDNVTGYADEGEFSEKLKLNLIQPDLTASTANYSLYQTFWSLQNTIRNPFDNGDLSETWPKTMKSFNTVLASLERTTLVSGRPVASLFARFPKYLTDPCVLHLQFADVEWRRHVLTQFIMFLSFIKTVGDDLGESRNNTEKLVWERNKLYCKHFFVPDGLGYILCLRILKLLDKDDPDGKYANYAAEILDNEAHWIHWKHLSSCPKLDKNAYQPVQPFTRKRRKLSTVEHLEIDGDNCVLEKPLPGMPPSWISRQDAFKVIPASSVMSLLEKRHLPEIETSADVRNLLEADILETDEELKLINDPKFSWLSLRAMCLTDMNGMAKVMCESSKYCVDFEKLLSSPEEMNEDGLKQMNEEAQNNLNLAKFVENNAAKKNQA
eukprot:IDg10928t1